MEKKLYLCPSMHIITIEKTDIICCSEVDLNDKDPRNGIDQ